jgi:hypothetical protein
MKKLYLFMLLPFLGLAQEPEPVDCADLAFTPAEVIYINQGEDTHVYGSLDYIGDGDLSYAVWSYVLDEGSPITITETVATHGVMGPFHYENVLGHEINYILPDIPANTVVEGVRIITHMSVPDGCVSPVTFIINANAGINDVSKSKTLNAYPNPFITTLTIAAGDTPKDIVIHDTLGRIVKQLANVSGNVTINRDTLPQGIYFVSLLQNGQRIASTKIIASLN